MPVATSAVFELIDALLAKFRANATLTANSVQIVDGPPLEDLSSQNILFVGAQPSDETGASPDATFVQSWGELGARARYEDQTVVCELWVRDGGTNMAALRSTARTLLAAVEADLRTDFALSIGRLMWCHITSGQVMQIQTNKGATIAVPFVVTGRGRLASQ